ncbi:MAG: hypothetical protein ACI965_002131 [Paraglaciecola sp.]|jgi:hypothetical protein
MVLLKIKGAWVSIETMGCQKKIAKTNIDKGSNYLLAVKGAHEILFTALKFALTPTAYNSVIGPLTIEQSHGQKGYPELRATTLLDDVTQWEDLSTIGVAIHYA